MRANIHLFLDFFEKVVYNAFVVFDESKLDLTERYLGLCRICWRKQLINNKRKDIRCR